MTATGTLVLLLPFLLSLAGRATMPKMLCLVTSLLALLLSVQTLWRRCAMADRHDHRRGRRLRALAPLPRRLNKKRGGTAPAALQLLKLAGQG
jgi:hypothetical protein